MLRPGAVGAQWGEGQLAAPKCILIESLSSHACAAFNLPFLCDLPRMGLLIIDDNGVPGLSSAPWAGLAWTSIFAFDYCSHLDDSAGMPENENSEPSEEADMANEEEESTQHCLWVDRFTPRHYTELLSDDVSCLE